MTRRASASVRPGGTGGFTLVELLIAMALTLAVVGAATAITDPVRDLARRVPEEGDLLQRERYLVQVIRDDLSAAGLGTREPEGALVYRTAAVLPYRIGLESSDPRRSVHFRPDVLTTVFVPADADPRARPVLTADRPALAVTRTWSLRRSPEGGQLMLYDGQLTDLPIVDDVIALSFDYLGDPAPPRLEVSADGRVSTTYGPAPPPLAIDLPGDGAGAGENCAFAVVGGVQVPRLAELAGGTDLQPLPPEMLTDGPWCPGTSVDEPFDADLLRVRRVVVRARLQARKPYRGPAGAWWRFAGTAETPLRQVPDRDVRFTVTPRNLMHGR